MKKTIAKKVFATAMVATLATTMTLGDFKPVNAATKTVISAPEYFYDFEGDAPLANKGTATADEATIVGAGEVTEENGNKCFDNASTASSNTTRENYLSLPNSIVKAINGAEAKAFTFSTKIKVSGKYSQWSPLFVMDSSNSTSAAPWPYVAVELRGTTHANTAGWFNADGSAIDAEGNAVAPDVDGKVNGDITRVNDGSWHTVTATFTKGYGSKVYVDGTLIRDFKNGSYYISEADKTAGTLTEWTVDGIWDAYALNMNTVALGGNQVDCWNDPDTQIYFDDVAIFTSELSADEIKSLSDDTYAFDNQAMDIFSYRDTTYTAPTKSGKIFAGWYTDADYTTPVADDATTGYAYAKFVDAALLTTKCQARAGATAESESTDLRMMLAVDGLDYTNVGFDVAYNGNTYKGESTTVFKKIVVTDNETQYTYNPSDFFGDSAIYMLSCILTDIPQENFDKTIAVTPYWTTLDGTKVTGATRNVTITDAFQK